MARIHRILAKIYESGFRMIAKLRISQLYILFH